MMIGLIFHLGYFLRIGESMKKIIIVFFYIIIASLASCNDNVMLRIIGKEQVKEIYVDKNIESLVLTKTESMVPKLKNIQGLEKLKSLRELTIEFSDMTLADFTFFDDNKNLEILRLKFITVNDLSFIGRLQNLKRLYLTEGIEIKNSSIDLSKNPEIEYIQIWGFSLDSFPFVSNSPNSFLYLDIAWSNLSDFNIENLNPKVVYVIKDKYLLKINEIPENIIGYKSIRGTLPYSDYN